jgi:hypothetical protein
MPSWNSIESTILRRTAIPLLLGSLLSCPMAGGASADMSESALPTGKPGFCSRPFSGESIFRSQSSQDLYNGILWWGGTAAVRLGTETEARWTRTNRFDDGIRRGLRAESQSTRKNAKVASDVLLGVTAGLVPLVSIGKTLVERDCHKAYDMTTDVFESIGLTLFLTQTIKTISGRERPYVQDCNGSTSGGEDCGDSNSRQSFFSGHASMAAAGAGVVCSYAIKQKTWGDGIGAQTVPCVLSASAAIAVGVLRIVADKHWGSDVIMGLAVGATIGYFDTWGPFDLLRFEFQSHDLAWDVHGIILPYVGKRQIGVRAGLTF